jgi:hypothetical protein
MEQLDLDKLIDQVPELAEYVPYLRAVYAAGKWIRNERAKHFLRSLKAAAETLPPERKAEFERRLSSAAEAEILSDYADTVLETASKTATAALALLYADVGDIDYPKPFKVAAVLALHGITEEEVDAFLKLSSAQKFVGPKNQPSLPYPVAVANDQLIADLHITSGALASPESRVAVVNDLVR